LPCCLVDPPLSLQQTIQHAHAPLQALSLGGIFVVEF
jgi:hypothetical protein